jgi:hypothetical protein
MYLLTMLLILSTNAFSANAIQWSGGMMIGSGYLSGGPGMSILAEGDILVPWAIFLRGATGPALHLTQGLHPIWLGGVDLGWPVRLGTWYLGPDVTLESTWGTTAEQDCNSIGGCLYGRPSPSVGILLRHEGSRSVFDGFIGIEMASVYDSGMTVPRIRGDWRLPSGWTVGAEVTGDNQSWFGGSLRAGYLWKQP